MREIEEPAFVYHNKTSRELLYAVLCQNREIQGSTIGGMSCSTDSNIFGRIFPVHRLIYDCPSFPQGALSHGQVGSRAAVETPK